MCDVFKVEGTKADGRVFVELPNGDEVNLFLWAGMEGMDDVTALSMVRTVGDVPIGTYKIGSSYTGLAQMDRSS